MEIERKQWFMVVNLIEARSFIDYICTYNHLVNANCKIGGCSTIYYMKDERKLWRVCWRIFLITVYLNFIWMLSGKRLKLPSLNQLMPYIIVNNRRYFYEHWIDRWCISSKTTTNPKQKEHFYYQKYFYEDPIDRKKKNENELNRRNFKIAIFTAWNKDQRNFFLEFLLRLYVCCVRNIITITTTITLITNCKLVVRTLVSPWWLSCCWVKVSED